MADKKKSAFVPYGVALGLPIGVALGVTLDNLALFLGVGLIIGALIDAYGYYAVEKKNTPADPPPAPSDETE
jgi:hypothetical protein